MKSDMDLIMEGWRGYLLEEQAMHELHQELLTEDFAGMLQKLKDTPGAIKGKLEDIKNNTLNKVSDAWAFAGQKAYNAQGTVDDFVKDHLPDYQRFAVPVLRGLIMVGLTMGCRSCKKVAPEDVDLGRLDISIIAEFLAVDLQDILQKVGLGENVQRL